jgi:hypothetical protein
VKRSTCRSVCKQVCYTCTKWALMEFSFIICHVHDYDTALQTTCRDANSIGKESHIINMKLD